MQRIVQFIDLLWSGSVCANLHIILARFWHKKHERHNIVLTMGLSGSCTGLHCTCGKIFFEKGI